MKTLRIVLISSFFLVLVVACGIETFFDRPIYKYASLQIEYATLPKLTIHSDENFQEFSYLRTASGKWQQLFWTEEEITRLKALTPDEKFTEGVFSPSGKILITISNQGARIRDREGNLVSDALIPVWKSAVEVYFSPDEKEIAFSEYEETNVWMSRGFWKTTLSGWRVFGYSPDGRYLVANGENGLALLDRENDWEPNYFEKYDEVRGVVYSDDQQSILTFGCADGIWWESGFFCFRGGAALWDQQGNKLADFHDQDDVIFAGLTKDMKHVVTRGCDQLWTLSRAFPIQECYGVSTRYYDLQGNLEGIDSDQTQDIHYLGRW